MKFEDQVANLELSKKLKDLGVKQDSLFSWLHPWEPTRYVEMKDTHVVTDSYRHQGREFISAFTVAELGEMLGIHVNDISFGPFGWRLFLGINQESFEGKEADARAKMLIHLIEKGIVKP